MQWYKGLLCGHDSRSTWSHFKPRRVEEIRLLSNHNLGNYLYEVYLFLASFDLKYLKNFVLWFRFNIKQFSHNLKRDNFWLIVLISAWQYLYCLCKIESKNEILFYQVKLTIERCWQSWKCYKQVLWNLERETIMVQL